jgi:two-component system, sensor histidine kinase PdtaS
MKLQYIFLFCIGTCSVMPMAAQVPLLIGQARSLAYSDPVRAIGMAQEYLSSTTLADTARFSGLRTLGLIQEESGQLDAARKSYEAAKELAESKLGIQEQLKIWADWAILHKKSGDFETARTFHSKCIELGLRTNDLEAVENNYHGLATMYSMMSLFDLSAEAYRSSIHYAEKRGNKSGHTLSLQNLANIYRKAQNYQLAYQYGFEALHMAKTLQDSFRVASVCNIIGSIYLGEQKLDSAQIWLEQAKSEFIKMNHKQKLSEVLLALTDLYLQKELPNIAKQNLDQAAEIRDVFSPYSIALFAQLQGKILVVQRNYKAAIEAFKLSSRKTNPFGFDEIARGNCLQLQNIYHTIGQDDSSFVYAQKAQDLSEKIFNDARLRHMTESGQKYQLQKLETELAVKEEKLLGNHRVKWLLISGIFISTLLLLWLAFINRQRNKAVRLSTVLLKELNHRTKNNLQMVVSMMRIQARQITDPVAQEVLHETRSRMEAISMIHQKMYEKFEFRDVDMASFIEEILEKLIFSYAPQQQIARQLSISKHSIDIDKAIPLALIINELITNSLKHGLTKQHTPCISIALTEHEFRYADNGTGYSYNAQGEMRKHFGISLIESLAKSVGNDLRFQNDCGAVCTFHLRKK